jgi:hypothetical protein
LNAAVDYVVADRPKIAFADLVVTEHIIRQAQIGVIAAELVSTSPELTGLRQAVSNIQPGMLPSLVDAILPQNASELLDHVLLMVAAGDDGLLQIVNDTARNGGDDGLLQTVNDTARNGGDVSVVNRAPAIQGSPPTEVVVGASYDFMPVAGDPDGDTLTFAVSGKPDWANFDVSIGRLSGTPGAGDVGTHGGIVITASDGEDNASLEPFAITVESIGMGSATLSWTAPTENEDGSPLTDLAGYKIYWATMSGPYPNSVTINNPRITTYVIENLAPGTYEFVSTAFNSAGVESTYSNTATKTIP